MLGDFDFSTVVVGPAEGIFFDAGVDETMVRVRIRYPMFDSITADKGAKTTAISTFLKSLRDHNNGCGAIGAFGVVTNIEEPYKIHVYDAESDLPYVGIYGRLFYEQDQYNLKWFLEWEGKETIVPFSEIRKVKLSHIQVSMAERIYRGLK